MKNEMVSVIIAVYNGERFIEKCIKSLVNQKYPNIEIIVVDDGSTDQTHNICMRFADADQILLITVPNEGVSHARNIGITNARGKYITFVDSDDYVEDNYIEVLVNNLEKYQADISVCNYNYVINNCFHPISFPQKFTGELDRKTFLEGLIKNCYRGFLWNKMFRMNQIKNFEYSIKLDESIAICEDLLFVISLSEHCKKIYVDNRPLYNYIQIASSAYNCEFNESRLTEIKAYDQIISIVSRVEPDLVDSYKIEYLKMALKIQESLVVSSNMEMRAQLIGSVKKAIEKYFDYILSLKDVSLVKKIYYIFYRKYPSLIHNIKTIYHKVKF